MVDQEPRRFAKHTYEDYLRYPDDGKRHEVIDGDHVVGPPPNLRHQRILGNLYWHLRAYLRKHPLGDLYTDPLEVVLSPHDVVKPDLVFVANDRTDVVVERNFRGTPDLVVEVVSPRLRKIDERIKFRRYEHFGVEEYWIVDPELKALKVFRQTGSGFARVSELGLAQKGVLRTPIFPRLSLPLLDVFQD